MEKQKNMFSVKHFKMGESGMVFSQIEFKMSAKEIESLQLGDKQEERSNEGNNLMLYLDKSGSMAGSSFSVLKEACVDIGQNVLFSQPPPFENIRTVFYNNRLFVSRGDFT